MYLSNIYIVQWCKKSVFKQDSKSAIAYVPYRGQSMLYCLIPNSFHDHNQIRFLNAKHKWIFQIFYVNIILISITML